MPSPFPGMDPWLESPYIWGDFHHAFACALSTSLNSSLPKGYYSRINFRLNADDSKHQYLEVRGSKPNHELSTFIDFATPKNKTTGPERRAYLRNRAKMLKAGVGFLEFDFLRGGRPLNDKDDDDDDEDRSSLPEYSIVIRSPEKPVRMCRTFTLDPRVRLPSIRVPIREGMQGIDVDIQELFDKVYDSGPYDRGAVDYDKPPDPPLPVELEKWAQECLRKAALPQA
jgi:Protein of unknown function (DUF4058)